MKKELAALSQEAANLESRLNSEVCAPALHLAMCSIAGGFQVSYHMRPAPSAQSVLLWCSRHLLKFGVVLHLKLQHWLRPIGLSNKI